MMTSPADLHAAHFAGTVWAAIHAAGGTGQPATAGHRHYPEAFDPEWLAALAVPTGTQRPPDQPVALLDENDTFDRHHDGQTLADAYAHRPRTQVYEDIGRTSPRAWYALAARHLGRLAHCDLQVVCSIFASRCGDDSLGGHFDTWYGAIVQLDGAKTWRIGPGVLGEASEPPRQLTTRPGDVLVLPKYLPHAVATPKDPGHSVHLTFAIDRDRDRQAPEPPKSGSTLPG